MVSRFVGWRWAGLALLCMAWTTGCECDSSRAITLTAPDDGAELTLADDTNPGIEGVQIVVRARVTRFEVGDAIDLWLDGTTVSTATVPDDGVVEWEDVTIPSGSHTLQATTPDGDVTSNIVTVNLSDGCFSITYITPEPVGDEITFGPDDDTDGERCGETFETEIVVATAAPDGSMARIYVNDTPQRTATVTDGAIRFDGVAFDRGATSNSMRVEVTSGDGVTCDAAYPLPILVDCDGVACRISDPTTDTAFLNQDDDVSDAPGFQGQFEVTTSSDGVGQPIRLVIDGNESGALSESPMMVGMDGIATFGNVELSEGLHRFEAICEDAAGNISRSAPVEWTVDITPCGASFATPDAGALITDLDDIDAATDGIQIEATGSADADCRQLRAGLCSGIAGAAYSMVDDAWSRTISVGSSGVKELCVQVLDEAENVGEVRREIEVRTEAPQLEIASPSDGAAYNREGTDGRVADLDPATSTCEAAFEVLCTEAGSDVTLLRQSTMSPLTGGMATCVAEAGLPAPYAGRATFASVTLPSLSSLTSIGVVARQSAGPLVGLSDPIAVLSDCDPPQLSGYRRPMCGGILRPSTQDEDMSTPGFQYEVEVFNTNTPKPPVELELRAGGTAVYGPVTSSTPATGIVTTFPNADFGSGGVIDLVACATDMAGNTGCAPTCTVTVEDLPTLSITRPTMGDVLDASDDCDTGTAGLQILVEATTSAAAGSAVTIQIGSSPATMHTLSGGSISECVDAPQGRDLPVRVTVTDPVSGTVSGMVTVTIDSLPPTDSITDFTAVLPAVDNRAGQVRFTWTAVDDAGGGLLTTYELRCSTAGPIDTEAAWSAATVVPVTTTPAAAGTMQSETLGGFRLGVERWCALRGTDAAGALTPLPASAPGSVTLEPSSLEATGTTTALGTAVAAVGDINGDSIDDYIAGSTGGEAYLYFGSTSGPSTTPDVVIEGEAGSAGGYGRVVAGLGDVTGDGLPDFAISARALGGLAGKVYIFFGRPSATAWPSVISLGAGGCQADVCLTSSAAPALFGWDIESAGDFDGDGLMDIVIGAWQANGAGRAFVILGRPWTSGSSFDVPGVDPTMAPDGFVADAPSGTTRFGTAVAGLGDISGDGLAEVVIGASGTGTTPGAIVRIAGRTFPAGAMGLQSIGSTGVTIPATGPAGTFGVEVSPLGDFDGDGFADLGVHNTTGNTVGGVNVYLQRSGTFTTSDVRTYTNGVADATNDFYGFIIARSAHPWLGAIGDFDGDGLTDLLTGSQERGLAFGTVELFYGASPAVSRARSTADVSFDPAGAMATCSIAASGCGDRVPQYVGDLNGDGFNDIAIGDPSARAGEGRIVVLY